MCVVYFGQCWRLAECWPCLWRNCAVLVSSGILRPFWNWAIRPVQVWTAGSLLPLRWLSDGSTLTVTTWFTFRASGSFCKCIHLQKKEKKVWKFLTECIKLRGNVGECECFMNCWYLCRHILSNGSLILPPFRSDFYRPDVHQSVYRCVATNTFGSIVSPSIVVKTGLETKTFVLTQHLITSALLSFKLCWKVDSELAGRNWTIN